MLGRRAGPCAGGGETEGRLVSGAGLAAAAAFRGHSPCTALPPRIAQEETTLAAPFSGWRFASCSARRDDLPEITQVHREAGIGTWVRAGASPAQTRPGL